MVEDLSFKILNLVKENGLNNSLILELFQYQYSNNLLYQQFCNLLKKTPLNVKEITDIPFLPVDFFKTHHIKTNDFSPQVVFTSSGTTGQINSQHLVRDVSIYENTFIQCFQEQYGSINQYCILALLPSYLEREGSSLVYMANKLIELTQGNGSGFYLYNHQELNEKLINNREQKMPTVLLGVTFALLDFADNFYLNFPELIVMETGGMKGKRKEIVRSELHQKLKKSFNVNSIHSEYGMTEMLSQAYSKADGIYTPSSTMKILVGDANDPLDVKEGEGTGLIKVIDSSNIDSCSFIATQDIGKIYSDGTFEVMGRFANSDMRGCNLMVV